MTSREHRELTETLSRFPVFAGCERDDLLALARAGRVRSVPSGWTFVHEGTPADACYVLLDGEVRVRAGGGDKDTIGPGAVLGEMGLLGRSLRSASLVSSGPVQALRVEYPDLAALLDARPRLRSSFGAVYEQHRGTASDPA